MADTTIKKIEATHSPTGAMGQTYLASGKKLAMRLWEKEPGGEKEPRRRPYETVGYVIEGRAHLEVEGQTVELTAGDSWVVPEGAEHTYEILETFVAVEATAPPARVNDRDDG